MPQLKIRGIKVDDICKISTQLIDELEKIIGCPRNYFTIEHIGSTFIKDGNISEGYPFVEILWFDRGQEIQDKTAKIITNLINELGYKNIDLFFTPIKENLYYENGEHF